MTLLPHGGFEAVPGGLRNVVGELPGRAPAIVVGAHYDSTPVPGYLGANNSAAGVAAVVELARALAGDPRRPGDRAVRFALFDGEEAPAGFTDFYAQGDRGSKAYVAAHADGDGRARAARLHRQPHPADPARGRVGPGAVGAAARRGGRASAPARRSRPPRRRRSSTTTRRSACAGIPAIDLIDFDYACWQQRCDTLAQVSRAGLDESGRTVLALVRAERSRR